MRGITPNVHPLPTVTTMSTTSRQHGTQAGYFQHIRRDEPPCPDCVNAYNERARQRHAAKTAHRRMTEQHRAAAGMPAASDTTVCSAWSPKNPRGVTGTPAGAKRHYVKGEPPCGACRTANAVYSYTQSNRTSRANRPLRPAPQPGEYLVCADTSSPYQQTVTGTPAGASRHYKIGEHPCEPCRLAHNEHKRRERAQRRRRVIAMTHREQHPPEGAQAPDTRTAVDGSTVPAR